MIPRPQGAATTGRARPGAAAAGGARLGAAEAAMAQETRKQQIARRLRLSEHVLEQYLQLKRAEVEDETELAGKGSATAVRQDVERRPAQRRASPEKRA